MSDGSAVPPPPAAAPESVTLEFDFGTYVGAVCPDTKRRDGHGRLAYHSGNVYEGSWRQGAADGQGTKLFANGDRFVGQWSAGKRHGYGRYEYAAGHVYEGEYADDQCHGRGALETAPHGDCYEGEWAHGRRHGRGVELVAPRTAVQAAQASQAAEAAVGEGKAAAAAAGRRRFFERFEGTWERGHRHGPGTTTRRDGTAEACEWIEGRPRVASREATDGQLLPAADVAAVGEALGRLGVDPAMMGALQAFNSAATAGLGGMSRGLGAIDSHIGELGGALAALEAAADAAADLDGDGGPPAADDASSEWGGYASSRHSSEANAGKPE